MPRSPRASARRHVLDRLAAAKRTISVLQGWWDVTGRVPVEGWRDRRSDEYPEAQRRYWASTVQQLDHLTTQLAELRKYALDEYHSTPEEPRP